jgi:hypothetical protein
MARKSIEQRLAELDAKRATLVARKNKQTRTEDTRRKVLLGAFVLHRLENKPGDERVKQLSSWLRHELPSFLVRDADKPLFASFLANGEMDGRETTEGAVIADA